MSRVGGENRGPVIDITTVGGAVQSLNAQISNKIGEVQGLTGQLQALLSQLEAIQDPPAPGEGAKPEEIDAWRAKCSANETSRASLRSQIGDVQDKLAKAMKDLGDLQGKLPQAADRDREAVQKAMDAASKAMENASAATAPKSSSAGSFEVDNTEIIAQENRRKVLGRNPVLPGAAGGLPPIGEL